MHRGMVGQPDGANCPYDYATIAEAEAIHGKLDWTWEASVTHRGIRSTFNHGPRFIGCRGRLPVSIAIVPDTRKGIYQEFQTEGK